MYYQEPHLAELVRDTWKEHIHTTDLSKTPMNHRPSSPENVIVSVMSQVAKEKLNKFSRGKF